MNNCFSGGSAGQESEKLVSELAHSRGQRDHCKHNTELFSRLAHPTIVKGTLENLEHHRTQCTQYADLRVVDIIHRSEYTPHKLNWNKSITYIKFIIKH